MQMEMQGLAWDRHKNVAGLIKNLHKHLTTILFFQVLSLFTFNLLERSENMSHKLPHVILFI